MTDWNVGDWVFAYWEEDGYWYPAEITSINAESYEVKYDDGTTEWIESDSLAEYSTEAGEEGAEAYYESDDTYYEVTILEVNEEQVKVQYEDETVEWTDLSNLRFEG